MFGAPTAAVPAAGGFNFGGGGAFTNCGGGAAGGLTAPATGGLNLGGGAGGGGGFGFGAVPAAGGFAFGAPAAGGFNFNSAPTNAFGFARPPVLPVLPLQWVLVAGNEFRPASSCRTAAELEADVRRTVRAIADVGKPTPEGIAFTEAFEKLLVSEYRCCVEVGSHSCCGYEVDRLWSGRKRTRPNDPRRGRDVDAVQPLTTSNQVRKRLVQRGRREVLHRIRPRVQQRAHAAPRHRTRAPRPEDPPRQGRVAPGPAGVRRVRARPPGHLPELLGEPSPESARFRAASTEPRARPG